MNFINYLWQRAEYYTKVSAILAVLCLVSFTLALTYESFALHMLGIAILLIYFGYMIGYEMVYKSLKERYNQYLKEQNSLFSNIKDPK
jgi:Ca2+-dependent lipid-binding protein